MPLVVPATVDIFLTGRPHWRGPAGEGWLARVDAAWLSLLALSAQQPRDRVAAWIWPDAALRSANTTLRQRIFKLRQAIGHPLVESGAVLRLAPGVRADLLAPGADDEELLGGFDYGDLEAFEGWLTGQRQALGRRRAEQWSGDAARLEVRGEIAAALVLAERIVACQPTLEHGWRRLIRLHYLRGDRSAAIAAFERFERDVCRELGVRPAPETQALLALVERAATAPSGLLAPLPVSLSRPPRLVGREGSLQVMAQAWRDGRAVLIRGESGIGKSRLADAFLADRPGSLWVGLRASGSGMPYAAIATVLAAAFERFVPMVDDAARPELARLLPALGAAPSSPAHQTILWQAVRAALQAAVARGLAQICLDDGHHADDASLELIRWLLLDGSIPSVRWCVTARSAEGAATALERCLLESGLAELVVLSPLTRDEVLMLLDSLDLPDRLRRRADLADSLIRHAGGHPFFTLETLKSLIPDAVREGEPLPIPSAVRTQLGRRLETLSPPARDLLRLLALTDHPLPMAILSGALDLSLATLAQAWSELDAVQLTQGEAIAHDLVRDSVLAAMPAPARQALNLALARQLAQHDEVAPHLLAAHWEGAGVWPQAHDAWRAAARQARLAGRLEAWEDLLERAQAAAGRAGDESAQFDARFQGLSARMLRLGAESVLETLQRWLVREKRPTQRSRLQSMLGEALLLQIRPVPALAAGEKALRLAEPASPEWFEATVLMGRALAMAGRTADAIGRLQAAHQAMPAFIEPLRALRAKAALANALHLARRHVEALHWQSMAVADAREWGDATEFAQLLSHQAALAAQIGDSRLAYQASAEARRRFLAMGVDSDKSQTNAIYLARQMAQRGRLNEAVSLLEDVIEASAARSSPEIGLIAIAALAGVSLWLGDASRIERLSLRLSQIAIDRVMPAIQVTLLLTRLRLARHQGAALDEDLRRLEALGRTEPELRLTPRIYREWADWEPDETALATLEALIAECGQHKAHGAARSLELLWLERAVARGDPGLLTRARRVQREWPRGLLAGTYPPAAWWTLARVMEGGGDHEGAVRCHERARRWLQTARLPGAGAGIREGFLNGNPINRLVLGPLDSP
jgi:DNA-binding SARP family transcriptional activator